MPQMEQEKVLSLMSEMVEANSSENSPGCWRRKRANLLAVLSPTPGKREKSFINLSTGSEMDKTGLLT